MAFKRVDQIVQRIRNNMKTAKVEVPNPSVILDAMDEAQNEITQRGLAIEAERTLTFDAGVEVYDLGVKIFQLKSFIEPRGWADRIVIVSSTDEWAQRVRGVTGKRPKYAMAWDGRLKVWPAPSTTGEEVTVFMYLNASKQLELGEDPEVPDSWDKCLRYGALAELNVEGYEQRFEAELSRVSHQEMKHIVDGSHKMANFTDGIGF